MCYNPALDRDKSLGDRICETGLLLTKLSSLQIISHLVMILYINKA